MGSVVKLGSGSGSGPPAPANSPGAKRPPGAPAKTGSPITPARMAIGGAAVATILALGLWFVFGRGGAAPAASGSGVDAQGIYAPPELTGGASGAGPNVDPAAGSGAAGIYAPPEVTGTGRAPGSGGSAGIYAPPEVTGRR